ncbi:hypothetical protein [Aliiroseovarius lamellibrachiae]|uniref:hypothetical protein n=1 Tax=Aliiroseovarius lamellibrachiae TaxID=1924933 RepID=UPI001BDF9A1A|nr:hypothetical protein [Aliiroseovarius lamellibrachiae]MBT2132031.1 hypothetical protein [Aliiroseovarius lamellibrachiae]
MSEPEAVNTLCHALIPSQSPDGQMDGAVDLGDHECHIIGNRCTVGAGRDAVADTDIGAEFQQGVDQP